MDKSPLLVSTQVTTPPLRYRKLQLTPFARISRTNQAYASRQPLLHQIQTPELHTVITHPASSCQLPANHPALLFLPKPSSTILPAPTPLPSHHPQPGEEPSVPPPPSGHCCLTALLTLFAHHNETRRQVTTAAPRIPTPIPMHAPVVIPQKPMRGGHVPRLLLWWYWVFGIETWKK